MFAVTPFVLSSQTTNNSNCDSAHFNTKKPSLLYQQQSFFSNKYSKIFPFLFHNIVGDNRTLRQGHLNFLSGAKVLRAIVDNGWCSAVQGRRDSLRLEGHSARLDSSMDYNNVRKTLWPQIDRKSSSVYQEQVWERSSIWVSLLRLSFETRLM